MAHAGSQPSDPRSRLEWSWGAGSNLAGTVGERSLSPDNAARSGYLDKVLKTNPKKLLNAAIVLLGLSVLVLVTRNVFMDLLFGNESLCSSGNCGHPPANRKIMTSARYLLFLEAFAAGALYLRRREQPN